MRHQRRQVLCVVCSSLTLIVVLLIDMVTNGALDTMFRSPVAFSVAAGALTGFCETLAMYPLENLKTQMQLDNSRSMLETARRTLQIYGIAGLYRGISPILLGSVPTQAIRWGTFQLFCDLRHCGSSIFDVFVAGLMSGCCVAIITGIPVESMKTQLIHDLFHDSNESGNGGGGSSNGGGNLKDSCPSSFSGTPPGTPTTPAMSRTVAQSQHGLGHLRSSSDTRSPAPQQIGPSSAVITIDDSSNGNGNVLGGSPNGNNAAATGKNREFRMKGWIPTVFKKVVNQSVRFPVHAGILRWLCDDVACKGSLHPYLGFAAGAVAGLSSILVTQPIDVVKTRMQGLQSDRYGHWWQCFAVLLREEGICVFFTGIVPRSVRVALGAGITFGLYPVIRAALFE